eukprot:365527-Chlamydomonas_euryale.AAC.1
MAFPLERTSLRVRVRLFLVEQKVHPLVGERPAVAGSAAARDRRNGPWRRRHEHAADATHECGADAEQAAATTTAHEANLGELLVG